MKKLILLLLLCGCYPNKGVSTTSVELESKIVKEKYMGDHWRYIVAKDGSYCSLNDKRFIEWTKISIGQEYKAIWEK